MRNRTNYGGKRAGKQKPPIVPGWLWAGLISSALLIVVLVGNTIAFGLAAVSGGLSLICYPIQLFVYLFNGWLSGKMDHDRYRIQRRLNPRTPSPSYMLVGAAGGFVVAVIATIVYLVTASIVGSLVPPAVGIFGPSLLLLIVIDTIAAVGLGLIGGLFFGHYFR